MEIDTHYSNQEAEKSEEVFEPLAMPYLFGASVIGPLHIAMGLPCQDAYAHEALSSDFAVAAVADGLGSASKADVGAMVAVQSSVEAVKRLTGNKGGNVDLSNIAKEAIISARSSLETRADEEGCELRDLACTLIVSVINKNRVCVAHIGDGAVVVEVNGNLELISGPGDSEYANEVTPLTSKEWLESVQVSPVISDVNSLAAFTDGCQRAGLRRTEDGYDAFEGFFSPIFSYAKELTDLKEGSKDIKDLLASQKLGEYSEDDKTLVIAVLTKGD